MPSTTSSTHKAGVLARFASWVAAASGTTTAFITAVLIILLWAITGPLFKFSDTWQLVINTSTTIVTFLMVFLIQNSQDRDNAAIQAKLDELIRVGAARNEIVGIERLPLDEVEAIRCETEEIVHQKMIAESYSAGGSTQPRPK